MSLSTELEKLIALRDRGDLSAAEFEKAKALLLSGGGTDSPATVDNPGPGLGAMQKRSSRLWLALATTLAAVLSAVSVSLNPGPLKIVILVIWTVAAVLWWASWVKTGGGDGG